MNNPLNELSAVYQQSIAEGCGCDEKKKVKVELPGTKRPDGGDGAAPNDGKNLLATGNVPMGGSGAKRRVSKYAVEPLATEEYKDLPKRKMGMKAGKKTLSALGHALKAGTDGVGSIEDQKRGQQADKKAKQADKIHDVSKSHNPTLSKMKSIKNKVTGMTKESYDKPAEKLKTDRDGYRVPQKDADDAKARLLAKAKAKRKASYPKPNPVTGVYENWRHDLKEYILDPAETNDVVKTSPKNSDDAHEEIKEKKIKNKIKINPPRGVTEGFEELGAVVVEMYELTEKIDLKKADMGDVIKDFRKSDAPQFKGKSDKKIQQMAIAAKLDADEGSVSEETEEEKKKRVLMAKTRDHDDKQSGKLAEQSGGGLAKLGPREEGKRKEKGKKKPQAIRQSRAQLAALKRRLNVEDLSIEDQMRISREANAKRKPYQPGDREKQRAAQIRQMAKNASKDTRTDSKKMADAYASPRKGELGGTRAD